jgi:hypothetical protein
VDALAHLFLDLRASLCTWVGLAWTAHGGDGSAGGGATCRGWVEFAQEFDTGRDGRLHDVTGGLVDRRSRDSRYPGGRRQAFGRGQGRRLGGGAENGVIELAALEIVAQELWDACANEVEVKDLIDGRPFGRRLLKE